MCNIFILYIKSFHPGTRFIIYRISPAMTDKDFVYESYYYCFH